MADDAEFTARLLDEITRPAKTMVQSIETIIGSTKQLDRALQDIDDAMAHQKWVAMKRGEAAIDRMSKAGKIAGVEMDALAAGTAAGFFAAGTAVVALGAAAVTATAFVGHAAVEAGEFAQASTNAISQLRGGMGDAGAEFDEVRHLAENLGLGVETTTHAFQHFLAMQFTPDGAKDLIKLGADLQSIGTTAEQVQSVFHQLAMVKSLGKLGMGSLTNIAQAGVSEKLVIEALAEQLHKTPEQIQKGLSNGAIKADEGIEAIKTAIMHKTHEHALGEAGEAFASTTLVGMQQKFKAGIDNVLIDIGKAILPQMQDIAKSVTEILTRIMDSGKLDQVRDGFILVFHSIARFVEDNMPTIEKVATFAIDAIIFTLRTMASVIDFVSGHWETISTVIKGVGIVLGIVGGVLLAVGAIFLSTIGAGIAAVAALVAGIGVGIAKIIEFGPAMINGFVTALANIGAVMAAIGSALLQVLSFMSGGDAFAAAFNWAMSLVDGLIQGIESFAASALEKVTGFADSIAASFKSALGIASPSKVFEEAGVFTVQGFVKGITANDNAIEGATADMATHAMNGADVKPAAAGGGGNTIGDINIPVNVTGVQDHEQAQEIGRTIGAQIRRELDSIFEKMQPATEAA